MRQLIAITQTLILPILVGIGHVSVYAQSSVSSSPQATNPFFLTRAKNLARQAAERQNGGLNRYRAEAAMYGPAVDAPHTQNADGSITFTFKGGMPGFVTPTVETIATVTPQGQVSLQYNGPLRSVALGRVQSPGSQPQPPTQPAQQVIPPLEKPVVIPSAQPQLPSSPPPRSSPAMTPKTPSPSSGLPTLQSTPAITPSQTLPSISSQPQAPTISPSTQPTAPSARTLPTSLQTTGIAADLFLSRAKNLARQAAIKTNGGLSQYRPEPSMFGPAAGTPHQKNQDGSITFRFRGGTPGYRTPTVESIVTVTPNSTVTITYNGPIQP